MRAVVQRVSEASVSVDGEVMGRIGRGLLILAGAERGDGATDVHYLAAKVAGLRIFEDGEGKMNLNVTEAGGAVLLISQFTLAGDARKGRRPSFITAESPDRAAPLVESLAEAIRSHGLCVETGRFQAHMAVSLVNDGPVTILLDSRKGF